MGSAIFFFIITPRRGEKKRLFVVVEESQRTVRLDESVAGPCDGWEGFSDGVVAQRRKFIRKYE